MFAPSSHKRREGNFERKSEELVDIPAGAGRLTLKRFLTYYRTLLLQPYLVNLVGTSHSTHYYYPQASRMPSFSFPTLTMLPSSLVVEAASGRNPVRAPCMSLALPTQCVRAEVKDFGLVGACITVEHPPNSLSVETGTDSILRPSPHQCPTSGSLCSSFCLVSPCA